MKLCLPDLSHREDFAGLDIGDRYVAAARAAIDKDGKAEIKNAGWMDLAPDATDLERLEAVRTLWRICDMPTYTVSCCMRSPSLAMKPFRYRNMTREELASAIHVEAEEALQTEADHFYVDWYLSGHLQMGRDNLDAGLVEGMFVAARRDEVEHQLNFIQRAGVYPTRLDAAPVAVANLYLHLRIPLDETVCLVSMTGQWADVAILGPGPYLYVRSILSRVRPWEENTPYLTTSLNDMLEYFESRLRRDPVQRILFTGFLPRWDTQQDAIGSALDLPVERWNPMQGTTLVGQAADAHLDSQDAGGTVLSVSLGLALERQARG